MASSKAISISTKVLVEVEKISESLKGPRFLFNEFIDEIAELIDKEMNKEENG